ncbi:hypothetical protein F6R98_19440 [Candidatus Methylospira mobilis]|uniref:Uncharacterized protein n=1 Tax=Candidatus Methylospira mobilis TaxID=1808979 RepID=A0A5Q0BL16_9GAMM|nr:hypothetical protein [Candidatus Methylospira mobilis]QFY44533.1 hypothetical protein F6R98_19440 [Candidatus Methylospira mobilis]WNV06036.1 hypothetical protein RP726_06360 [Candidatus Methylospira mobilis]
MKSMYFAVAMTAALASGAVFAGSDDVKWISQCIADNQAEGQTPETLTTYCTCMNNKMDDNETKTITQWEKTHKKEEEACAAQAKWKGK